MDSEEVIGLILFGGVAGAAIFVLVTVVLLNTGGKRSRPAVADIKNGNRGGSAG